MRLRQKQALLRLEKISQASSPSPNRQKKTEETNSNRFNPLIISKSNANKQPLSPQHDLSLRLKNLHQTIMDRKARNTLWEDAQNRRETLPKNHTDLLKSIVKGILLLGKGQQNFAATVLKGLKKGKKGMLQWVLCWLKQLFWLISLVLTNHHIVRH